jgi:hypothetical protein
MAKEKQETAAGKTAAKTPDQVELAIKCVCAVIGCGKADARTRVSLMPAEKVAKLAELEAAGNRKDAVPVLYS